MLDSGIRAFSRRRDILRRMVYVINFLSAVAAYGGHLAAKVLDRPERLRALTIVWALAVLGVLAVLVWRTMEPGKFQSLTWILLGFFAFRVILGRLRSR